MNALTGRSWPIPPNPPVKAAVSLLDAALAAVLMTILAAVLYPMFARPHSYSGPSCASVIRGVGNSLLIYTDDFDGRLPTANRWLDSIAGTYWNQLSAGCPLLSRNGTRYGYAFESTLSGVLAQDSRAESPLLFDSNLVVRNACGPINGILARPPRHNGQDSIFCRDGHVQSLALSDLDARWPVSQ